MLARKGIGVKLLGELLLYGNHRNDRGSNVAKLEPVCPRDFFYVVDKEVFLMLVFKSLSYG